MNLRRFANFASKPCCELLSKKIIFNIVNSSNPVRLKKRHQHKCRSSKISISTKEINAEYYPHTTQGSWDTQNVYYWEYTSCIKRIMNDTVNCCGISNMPMHAGILQWKSRFVSVFLTETIMRKQKEVMATRTA